MVEKMHLSLWRKRWWNSVSCHAIITFWVIFNLLACRWFLMIPCTCKVFQKFIKYLLLVHFLACKGFSYCYPVKYGFFDSLLLCIEGATLQFLTQKKPAQAWLFIIRKWCLAAQKLISLMLLIKTRVFFNPEGVNQVWRNSCRLACGSSFCLISILSESFLSLV